MIYWLGAIGAYIVLVFLLGPALKRSEAWPIVAAIGFAVANFIGIGLATNREGDRASTGILAGLRLGRAWGLLMAAIVGMAAVLYFVFSGL